MKDTLRENFKNLRNKVGISQSQLADFLNLDQSLISKFEKGERSLEVSALERACALFGCTLLDLENNNLDRCLKISFRKRNLTSTTLNQMAIINRIALNLIEINEMEAELSERTS